MSGVSMKWATLAAVIVASFVSEGAVSFRYSSWNIGHYAYGRWRDTRVAETNAVARAKEYNDFLDKLNAKVLGICEYSGNFTSNGVQAASAVFGRYRNQHIGPQESWQWNCQFLNGFKVLERRKKHYPKHHQRTYYVATKVDLGEGLDAWFVQTHLDWGNYLEGHEDDRNDQIRILIEDFKNEPRVVISGDFNVLTWHRTDEGKYWETDNPAEFQTFVKAGYTLANDGSIKTAPTHKPSMAIDNVIVRGFKISCVEVTDCGTLSDHMPVSCVLTVD